MFESKPKSLADLTIILILSILIQTNGPLANTLLVSKNFLGRGPNFRNLAMCMAQLRVLYIRVYPAFEGTMVRAWFRWLVASCSSQVDVKEGRNMTQVEKAAVSQVDWFRK